MRVKVKFEARVTTTLPLRAQVQRLLRLQKREVRIILDGGQFCPSVPLFNRLSWIPVYEEANVSKCTLAYERINNDVPEIIGQLVLWFLLVIDIWKVEKLLQLRHLSCGTPFLLT